MVSRKKKDQPLNDQQEVFVEHYLRSWNASEAARKAGYSEQSAREIGSRLLTNVNIQEAIEERMKGLRMETNEWYARVTEQARGNLGDFIEDDGSIDVKQARADNKLRLLQEYQVEQTYRKVDEGDPVPVTKTKIKLYSSQEALKMMGARLFTPKLQIEHIEGENPYTQMTEEELLAEINRRESVKQKASAPARVSTPAKARTKKAKPPGPRKR